MYSYKCSIRWTNKYTDNVNSTNGNEAFEGKYETEQINQFTNKTEKTNKKANVWKIES